MEIFPRKYESAIIADLLKRYNFQETFDILLEFTDSMEVAHKADLDEDQESNSSEENSDSNWMGHEEVKQEE